MRVQPRLSFVLVTVFIDMLGIGLLVPVLAPLIGSLATSKYQQSWWLGALTITYGAAQFVCAPLLGALSDRFGRRPVLLLSLFGLGTAYIITGFSHSLWLILCGRLLCGVTSANFTVASAYVADITPPEKRGQGFGLLGAAFGIGFIFGPAIGGFLGESNLRLPYICAAGLCFLNGLYGVFVLPESLAPEKRVPVSWGRANPVSALLRLARLRGAGKLVVVFAITMLAQVMLQTGWVLYTNFRFGWSPRQNGYAMLVVGITAGLVEGAFLGRLIGLLGEKWLALLGMASATLAFAGFGLVTSPAPMYAIIVANALSFAPLPVIQGLISRAAKDSAQGVTQGSLQALSSGMVVLAPLISTPLLALAARLPRDDWRLGGLFFACAAIQGVALVVAVIHFRGPQAPRITS